MERALRARRKARIFFGEAEKIRGAPRWVGREEEGVQRNAPRKRGRYREGASAGDAVLQELDADADAAGVAGDETDGTAGGGDRAAARKVDRHADLLGRREQP